MDKLINVLHHIISYWHTQRLPMSSNVHAIEICENVYEIDTFLSMPSSSTRYLFYNISRSIVSDRLTWICFVHFLLWQVQKAGGLLGVTSRGLLILALLLVFILILLVVIVVLAALWPRTKAQEAPKVCDTPSCLRAAAQVLSFFFWLLLISFRCCLDSSRVSSSRSCRVQKSFLIGPYQFGRQQFDQILFFTLFPPTTWLRNDRLIYRWWWSLWLPSTRKRRVWPNVGFIFIRFSLSLSLASCWSIFSYLFSS